MRRRRSNTSIRSAPSPGAGRAAADNDADDLDDGDDAVDDFQLGEDVVDVRGGGGVRISRMPAISGSVLP
jgi:hypothetical protein